VAVTPALRSALQNLALCAASLAVSLLAAELGLRLLSGPARAGKEQLERARYTEHDPVLGWRKRPGASVRFERRDYVSEWSVNRHGLRGPDRPYEKPAAGSRVLALGDSFVEAFMLDDAHMLTTRLEARLRERGCRSEVINGGTVGYGTDQEYLFFAEEGRKYAPDVVVVFVYHNDIPYLVLDRNLGFPKPLLSFETAPPTVTNLPVPPYQPPPAATPPPAPEAFARSYLLEMLKDRLERAAPRAYDRLAGFGLFEPLRRLEMNDELQLYRVPELGHLRRAWSAFTWTLESLGRSVEASGGRLVVAYVPSRMEVQDSVWELTQVRYGLAPGAYRRGAVAERVRYISDRLRLPVLDLTAPLTQAEGLLTPVYFPTDSHWNARGQDVAAAALADFLSHGPLPGCS
jgi:hypothetical protein